MLIGYNGFALTLKFTYRQNDSPERSEKKLVTKVSDPLNVADQQIWLEFQAGSESAYANIYKNHTSLLYNYGLKLVKDKQLIKDCIQDLFVELWNNKHRLGAVKSIKSYLYKSVRRKLLSESSRNRMVLHQTEDHYTPFEIVCSPERSLINTQNSEEQQAQLKQAMGQLTEKQREVIYLKYYDRLSYEEIADVMSISTKATYKIMGRAIHFLKQHIDKIYLFVFLIPAGLI